MCPTCFFTIMHMAQWSLPPERAPPWFHLESAVSSPLTPIAYISAKLAQQYQSHPILSHIQWVWKRVAKILKFDPYLHQAAGIWLNPKLCINKSPFLWKLWLQKGIRVLGDLYQDGTLKSFEALSQEFDLPRNQQWKYFQLRHLLVQVFGSPSVVPPSGDMLEKVLTIYGRGHEASAYYAMILTASDSNILSLKMTWETDLKVSFTDAEWGRILSNGKKMSRELRTRLIQFKILNRIYWTPSRLHKVGLVDNSECWRCQDKNGTFVHMLWSCPKIQAFWSSLHTIVEKIVEQNIPLTPSLFILGDPSALSDLAPPLSNWIQTVLMLGRKLVVKEWKAPSAPALDLWYAALGQLAALEHLSYRLLDKVEEYNLKWGKFHSYTLKV